MEYFTSLLICPVCGSSFTQADHTLQCTQKHTFDVAREGYVNLLGKHNSTGDTKEMLMARRNFLEHGYYDALSTHMSGLISTYLAVGGTILTRNSIINILDVGCGEGYHLGRLQQHLDSQLKQLTCHYLGLDISKEAVKMAAKKYKQLNFVVADTNNRLVLEDNTVQVVLDIFAPRNPAEFARVLTPKGLLLVVIPSPKHLKSLRSALHLLGMEEHKKKRVVEQFQDAFALVASPTLEYEIWLDSNEAITNIVRMTPNYWHMSQKTLDILQTLHFFKTEVGFTCLMFLPK